MRIIVGISGASGAIYGYRLLEVLSGLDVEKHVVVSSWAEKTLNVELGKTIDDVYELADCFYDESDLGAAISSGSFVTAGMAIAPCSMKTLAGIAHGFDENLIIRAASVCLKENRKLLLLTRETPLTAIHLENMLKLSRLGVSIMPPVPAFYIRPRSIEEIVDHTVARVLDHLNLNHNISERWGEKTIKEVKGKSIV